jgi:hypothetical protein
LITLIRKLVLFALFMVAIFLMVELSYRFVVVGPSAFDWRKMNSMTTLMRSEFVELSDDPNIFFQLKPNMQGWFKAQPFATNSAGLADKEYPLEKSSDNLRVAVVGSSWTMPSGVPQPAAWHSLLETSLSGEREQGDVEFINFGVELYGLREIVGTLKGRVPAWQPDLVVVGVTIFTTSFIWEEPDPAQRLPSRGYPGLQSFVLSSLSQWLGASVDAPGADRARFDKSVIDARLDQLQRGLLEIDAWSDATGVPVAVLFLGYSDLRPPQLELVNRLADDRAMNVIFANRLFAELENQREYQISRFDRHPNEKGHQLIADYLQKELVGRGLIEGAD